MYELGVYQPQLRPVFDWFTRQVVDLDPDLSAPLNLVNGCREVYDHRAPGGPKWQLVMRVMSPDGSPRPPTQRDIENLRAARGRDVMTLIDEMDARAEKREQAVQAFVQETAREFAEDLKWIGRRVVPSVAWRDRTDPAARERIRREAGL